MAALDAGYDVRASGVTLDRFCGSGITAVNLAAAQIMSGMEDLVIAGGTEMMSYTASSAQPRNPDDGPMLMDAGNLRLRAMHPQSHQGVCADAIATMEGISREALDELALVEPAARRPRHRGRPLRPKSLVPVYRETARSPSTTRSSPGPQTTLEGLAALKPSFAADGRRAARRGGHDVRAS